MNDPALCLGVYQGHVNRCVTFDVEYRISETVRDRKLSSKGPPIGNGIWAIKWSRDRWRHVTPKVLWGSTVGYPSDRQLGFLCLSCVDDWGSIALLWRCLVLACLYLFNIFVQTTPDANRTCLSTNKIEENGRCGDWTVSLSFRISFTPFHALHDTFNEKCI